MSVQKVRNVSHFDYAQCDNTQCDNTQCDNTQCDNLLRLIIKLRIIF